VPLLFGVGAGSDDREVVSNQAAVRKVDNAITMQRFAADLVSLEIVQSEMIESMLLAVSKDPEYDT
jgi:hypothetical protein